MSHVVEQATPVGDARDKSTRPTRRFDVNLTIDVRADTTDCRDAENCLNPEHQHIGAVPLLDLAKALADGLTGDVELNSGPAMHVVSVSVHESDDQP
jgi:hypothetical protein